MSDLLVNLLKLPALAAELEELERRGVKIRRAQPFEIRPVLTFVETNFSVAWCDEISVGFSNKPVSVFIAVKEGRILGFAGYECTRRGFFGPTGVAESMRGQGIGKALLLSSLHALRELGYVYGIIGGVGPLEYYQKAVGATIIPDSTPGIYTDPLK